MIFFFLREKIIAITKESSFVYFMVKVLLRHVWLFVTPWTIACQASLSVEFSRQEYWSGLPFPYPGDLLAQESNPGLMQLQALPSEPPGKPRAIIITRIWKQRETRFLLLNLFWRPQPSIPTQYLISFSRAASLLVPTNLCWRILAPVVGDASE